MLLLIACVDSLMVMISAFQAEGPGSIPGRRIFAFPCIITYKSMMPMVVFLITRTCGVMVSTKDSESFDPGSNPGKSFIIFRGHGATAARRIPDPKVGGSNPSGLIFC